MNKELGGEGIKSCALCLAFVDTPMTDFVNGSVPAAGWDAVAAVRAACRSGLERHARLGGGRVEAEALLQVEVHGVAVVIEIAQREVLA